MSNNRENWIDWLKVFALYLVVLGHLLKESYCNNLIYAFHMPLFFFLSGYLHKPKPVLDLVKRLIVPYILMNFTYAIVEFPWNRQSGYLFSSIISIFMIDNDPLCYPTWFLASLFFVKLLAQLSQNIYTMICMSIACLLFSIFINDTHLYPLHRTIVAFPYYVLGIIFMQYRYFYYRFFHNLMGGGNRLLHTNNIHSEFKMG